MSAKKTYTLAEVKGHNKKTDLWVIIHDKVYDVTKFLSEHPGGEEVLQEAAGKDATKDFDDVGHSDAAINLMKDYYIGEIVDEEKRSNRQKQAKQGTVIGSVILIAAGSAIVYFGRKLLQRN